jgi:hypothetical protein
MANSRTITIQLPNVGKGVKLAGKGLKTVAVNVAPPLVTKGVSAIGKGASSFARTMKKIHDALKDDKEGK